METLQKIKTENNFKNWNKYIGGYFDANTV